MDPVVPLVYWPDAGIHVLSSIGQAPGSMCVWVRKDNLTMDFSLYIR